MKAYVTTHCVWTSYGSVLQALGLKKALLRLGCESELLTDSPQPEYRLSFPKSAKDFYYFPKHFIRHRAFSDACRKGKAFIEKNLSVRCFPGYKALCEAYPHADVYIAGSDQIWLPSAASPLFLLDFVKREGERKVSYAASFGADAIPADKQKMFADSLADFAYISVREQKGRELLRGITDKEVGVHIDPTFLVSAEEWRTYEQPYPLKQPYILLYTIYRDDSLNHQLRQLSRRTGLPVYAVKPAPSKAYATKSLYDVGPAEFLWLIDHAAYVVTSSFHGAAFAAAFNKQLSLVINPKAPSRLDELRQRLGLPLIGVDALDSAPPIDYASVNQQTEQARAQALAYLKRVLQ